MKLKRAIYLGYYIKELNAKKFRLFLNHAIEETGRSGTLIALDVLKSVFVYNISILEYFQFRFYKLSKQEREAWAGTGYMYEYQLLMNPLEERHILDNKTLFYKHYGDFFVHKVADIEDLKNKAETAEAILANSSAKLVLKSADGKCGAQVEIRSCKDFDRQSLVEYMIESDYGLVEEFIVQHPKINGLSSSAVNTIRVITQVNDQGGVDILGSRFRISVNSPVDNMAAGNLAAPIDIDTGMTCGPGVYSDITKPEEEYHPVTNVKIVGFMIPYWEETIQMVKRAAVKHPQNRSIGWDVVVTERGPGLIEGNHDWCKLLWQLPVKEGLKGILENHLHESAQITESKQEVAA